MRSETRTSRQWAQVSPEATALLARYAGIAPPTRLHCYALELQLGVAQLPANESLTEHLTEVFSQAEPWLSPAALMHLQRELLLDASSAPPQEAAEEAAAVLKLSQRPSVELL